MTEEKEEGAIFSPLFFFLVLSCGIINSINVPGY